MRIRKLSQAAMNNAATQMEELMATPRLTDDAEEADKGTTMFMLITAAAIDYSEAERAQLRQAFHAFSRFVMKKQATARAS